MCRECVWILPLLFRTDKAAESRRLSFLRLRKSHDDCSQGQVTLSRASFRGSFEPAIENSAGLQCCQRKWRCRRNSQVVQISRSPPDWRFHRTGDAVESTTFRPPLAGAASSRTALRNSMGRKFGQDLWLSRNRFFDGDHIPGMGWKWARIRRIWSMRLLRSHHSIW